MMSLSNSVALGFDSTILPFVVATGQDRFNEPIKYRGISPNLVKISAKDTDGQLSIFEYEAFTKTGPELHMHLKQDEPFYILEGEYLFQVGEERHTLKVEILFLLRNIPHTWLQLTDRGKMMYMLQPAGKMEEFFKAMDALKRHPTEAEVQNISLLKPLLILIK